MAVSALFMRGELVLINFTKLALGLYTSNLQSCKYLDSRQKDAETISEILLKAASEPEFRNQLVKEPAKILEQYNISPEAKLIIRTSIADLTQ